MRKRKSTKALLFRVGEALYGDVWKFKMAKGLGINKRTMLVWCANKRPPPHQWAKVLKLVGEKNLELVYLIKEIEAAE